MLNRVSYCHLKNRWFSLFPNQWESWPLFKIITMIMLENQGKSTNIRSNCKRNSRQKNQKVSKAHTIQILGNKWQFVGLVWQGAGEFLRTVCFFILSFPECPWRELHWLPGGGAASWLLRALGVEINQTPKALSALENKQHTLWGTYYLQHSNSKTRTHAHAHTHTHLYIFRSVIIYRENFVTRPPKQHALSQASLTHTK